MRFSEISGRITGFSTPIFGVSWTPPQLDRDGARAVIVYLEDRRVLFTREIAASNPAAPIVRKGAVRLERPSVGEDADAEDMAGRHRWRPFRPPGGFGDTIGETE